MFRSGFGDEWLKNESMRDVKECARERLMFKLRLDRGKA